MPTYRVTFDRIGRNHEVRPLECERGNEFGLIESIAIHARPHLRSRDFDVVLDKCGTKGFIACGMHSGGDFTVQTFE